MKKEATGKTALTLAFVLPARATKDSFFSPVSIRLRSFD
jgi:hypothetical protein